MTFKICKLINNRMVLALLLAGVACQQVETKGKTDHGKNKVESTGKSAQVSDKIEMPTTAPIAPGTALVLLKVVKILPDLEPKGTGPCSVSPCKAEVQVQQLIGYGSSFSESLAQGQTLQVYFPMTVNKESGYPGASVGNVVKAELQAPNLNSTWFSIQHYSLVK